VVWYADYSVRGLVTISADSTVVQPLRLQGQYWDEESELASHRYRYFDPHIARFISQDPLGLDAGEDLYAYAPNVLDWVDPLGLNKCTVDGLSSRGYRPKPGERTIQGQVELATEKGNPTIVRGGRDLFRLRSSGHGSSSATTTPQNVMNITPDGGVFYVKAKKHRPVNVRDIKELYMAQTGHGISKIRTKSGKNK
tara:strand:+ start:983 stop:1570 length:588 start_codon:yes stop_codon:yes gene_type:complete